MVQLQCSPLLPMGQMMDKSSQFYLQKFTLVIIDLYPLGRLYFYKFKIVSILIYFYFELRTIRLAQIIIWFWSMVFILPTTLKETRIRISLSQWHQCQICSWHRYYYFIEFKIFTNYFCIIII
jgi:hypothetical protein